jgi:hypothetical protein
MKMADEQEYEDIESIKVIIKTARKWRCDTDDPVEIYVGGHTWELDNPQQDDFERGQIDTFDLEVPVGMDASWFRYFCIRKRSHISKDDNWCIEDVKVIINGDVVYEKEDVNVWLEKEKNSWCAPGFDYGQAGN